LCTHNAHQPNCRGTSCAAIRRNSCVLLLDGGGGLTCFIFRFQARRKFHGVGCSTGPPADQRQLADLPQSGRVWQCPGASSARSMKIDPSMSWDAGLSLVDTTGLLCLLVLLCKCPWGWPPFPYKRNGSSTWILGECVAKLVK